MSDVKHNTKTATAKKAEAEDPDIPTGKRAIFVVQKHLASHTHYDFRLEAGGVLKSWAIPKGPSTDPHDRRLAVMVEDHPLSYARFEGQIPEGEYGAGEVKIWDSGMWEPLKKYTDIDKSLREGELEFILYGKKLKGMYVLIRMEHSTAKNGWLLIKKGDH